MAWVYLDDHFPDHPKVVTAGGDAGWLFVCGLAYVKRYTTEGTIPKSQVTRLSDRKSPGRLARRLVEVGLWSDDGDHYTIHDYHDWNKPQENRSDAARKAARARWNRHRSDAEGNADADADASSPHDASESERTPDADASGCPPPLPQPTEDLSSSNGLTTRPDTPDDDDQGSLPSDLDRRVRAALGVLAHRDLDARQTAPNLAPVGNAVTWTNAAYSRRLESHGEVLVTLAAVYPDHDATQLAELADPAPTPTAGDPRVAGYDEQQRAERARAEEYMRQLEEERRNPIETDGSGLEKARSALRKEAPT